MQCPVGAFSCCPVGAFLRFAPCGCLLTLVPCGCFFKSTPAIDLNAAHWPLLVALASRRRVTFKAASRRAVAAARTRSTSASAASVLRSAAVKRRASSAFSATADECCGTAFARESIFCVARFSSRDGFDLETCEFGAYLLRVEKEGAVPGLNSADLALVVERAERPHGNPGGLGEFGDVGELVRGHTCG